MVSNKKIILFAFIAIILIGAIFIGINFIRPANNAKTEKMANQVANSVEITEIDFTTVASGTYNGKYELDDISVKVAVDIMNGRIENIQILSHQEDMNETANAMIKNMIEQQKIDVDVVSSATTSNTLIKKAIENALQK